MIVVDASLATKWRLVEPDSLQALYFLERFESQICGPELLAIEVCRAIVTAVNMQRVTATAGRRLIAGWLDSIETGRLPLYPISWDMTRRATDIAIDLGHPLADCLYLALAIEIGADLVTCDARFATKAAQRYANVKLLTDHG